jgi:hypothetical protein
MMRLSPLSMHPVESRTVYLVRHRDRALDSSFFYMTLTLQAFK